MMVPCTKYASFSQFSFSRSQEGDECENVRVPNVSPNFSSRTPPRFPPILSFHVEGSLFPVRHSQAFVVVQQSFPGVHQPKQVQKGVDLDPQRNSSRKILSPNEDRFGFEFESRGMIGIGVRKERRAR